MTEIGWTLGFNISERVLLAIIVLAATYLVGKLLDELFMLRKRLRNE